MELFELKVDSFDSALRSAMLSQNEFSKISGIVPLTFTRARKGGLVRISTVRATLVAMGKRYCLDDFFIPKKTKVGNFNEK